MRASKITLQTSPLLALPRNPLPAALQDWKACMCPEVYPIWERMAENSCISALVVDGEYHDKLCYSGKINGRCCQATRVHSDHRQFSPQQSRRTQQLFLRSSLRQDRRWPRPRCQVEDPQWGDCKGLLLHREQSVYGAASGYGGIKTCSDACSDAQSTAMYPWQTSLQGSARLVGE